MSIDVLWGRMARIARALGDASSVPVAATALTSALADPRDLAADPGPVRRYSDAELREPSASAIPPIVFQTWKSRTEVPANYAYWRRTFLEHNPDFKVVLWDDDDNRGFVERHFPWLLEAYVAYPREIFRADLIRLLFLFRYGGVYADMDSECVRPLDPLLGEGQVVLGRMGQDPRFDHAIPNAIMASAPGQGFWLLALACALERQAGASEGEGRSLHFTSSEGPEYLTGPILIKDAAEFYMANTADAVRARIGARVPAELATAARFDPITLLPRRRFYAVNWSNPFHRLLRNRMHRVRRVLAPQAARSLFRDAYIVTYWSHSW